jgi:hypothetical protein
MKLSALGEEGIFLIIPQKNNKKYKLIEHG